MTLRGWYGLLVLGLLLAVFAGCEEATDLTTPWSDEDINGGGDSEVIDGWRMIAISVDGVAETASSVGSRTMVLDPGGSGTFSAHATTRDLTWSTTNGYLTLAVRDTLIDIYGDLKPSGVFSYGTYLIRNDLLTYVYSYGGKTVTETWTRGIEYGQASLPETSHDFGLVPINVDSTWMLPVENIGSGPLTVFSLTSTDDGIFQVPGNVDEVIEPGQTGYFPITFAPENTTFEYGPDTVYVNTDDTENPEFMVIVNGIGDLPAVAIHFNPVDPTGDPYTVNVVSVTIDGDDLPLNGEVGLFDGELCVGAATVSEDQWDNSLAITAWRENQASEQPGFVTGHQIAFKVWDANSDTEYTSDTATIDAAFIAGNGTFGSGFASVVTLTLTTATQD